MTLVNRIVVFRFDRNPLICRSGVALLRSLNPGLQVHGLYGGGPGGRQALLRYGAIPLLGLDSLYVSPRPGRWNWKHGDLALAAWYREVGRHLDFDVAHLVEWDLLLLDSLDRVYADVPPDAVALTCLTPLTRLLGSWEWLRTPEGLREWESLLSYARLTWGYQDEPLGCIGCGPAFSRAFLDAYARIDPPELCHDELRLPLVVQSLGFPLVDTGFRRSWDDPVEDRYFAANATAIQHETITAELQRPGGRRAFHPVRHSFRLPAHTMSLSSSGAHHR
ncbi:hypothetical protein ACWDWO_13180 [Actinopolymorpha singaporensis]